MPGKHKSMAYKKTSNAPFKMKGSALKNGDKPSLHVEQPMSTRVTPPITPVVTGQPDPTVHPPGYGFSAKMTKLKRSKKYNPKAKGYKFE